MSKFIYKFPVHLALVIACAGISVMFWLPFVNWFAACADLDVEQTVIGCFLVIIGISVYLTCTDNEPEPMKPRQLTDEEAHLKWSKEMKQRVGEDLRDPTGLIRIAEAFGGFCVLALYVVGSIFGALICGAVIGAIALPAPH